MTNIVSALVRAVIKQLHAAAAAVLSGVWLRPTRHDKWILNEGIFRPGGNRLLLVTQILGHVITNVEWNQLTSPLGLELKVNTLVYFVEVIHVFLARDGLALKVTDETIEDDAIH